jgi:predicted small lipoprotein YifL
MNYRHLLLSAFVVFFLQACGLKGPLVLPPTTSKLATQNQNADHTCIPLCSMHGNQEDRQ